MSTQSVVVYGAGGFAREVAWLIDRSAEAGGPFRVVCFVDDDPHGQGQTLNGVPVLSLEQAVARFPGASVSVGIGAPSVRRRVTEKAVAAGLVPRTVIDPSVLQSRWNTVGDGSVICAGTVMTCNITLGANVQVNLDCTIGHDVVMEDYATLAPGVHVSGFVRICREAYVGTGANIINGTAAKPLVIGEGAVIGAGACVTKDVPPGATAVGVPAKPLVRG